MAKLRNYWAKITRWRRQGYLAWIWCHLKFHSLYLYMFSPQNVQNLEDPHSEFSHGPCFTLNYLERTTLLLNMKSSLSWISSYHLQQLPVLETASWRHVGGVSTGYSNTYKGWKGMELTCLSLPSFMEIHDHFASGSFRGFSNCKMFSVSDVS